MIAPDTAIILAAGRGSRLGPHTADRPKCLVPLDGKPLLLWQRDAMLAAGISRIVAVGGYCCAQIRATGIETILNPDWEKANMVASLLAARSLLDRPAIVSYSDIVYGPDAVSRLAANDSPLAITYDRDWLNLWKRRFADPLSDAETFRLDAAGRVCEIGGRAGCVGEIQGQYMGLLKLAPPALDWIDEILARAPDEAARARMDMTTLLRHLIAQGRAVDAIPVSGGWCEIDNPSDLAVAEALLAEGRLPRATRRLP